MERYQLAAGKPIFRLLQRIVQVLVESEPGISHFPLPKEGILEWEYRGYS